MECPKHEMVVYIAGFVAIIANRGRALRLALRHRDHRDGQESIAANARHLHFIQYKYAEKQLPVYMDVNFCVHYRGDGFPPTNRFCRECPVAGKACDKLWSLVVALSESNDGGPVELPGTRAVMSPNPKNWNIVRLKINCKWNLGKEDFLYFISTGHAHMGRKDERLKREASPSMTRQTPYVQSIVEAIGGYDIPEIVAVREFQKENPE